jgi:platelet-activating factor acetylhydrolase IB subunit alpha
VLQKSANQTADPLLLSSSKDCTIRIWNTETSLCVSVVSTNSWIRCLEIVDDTLVVGSSGGSLRIFNLSTEKEIDAIDCHDHVIESITAVPSELMQRILHRKSLLEGADAPEILFNSSKSPLPGILTASRDKTAKLIDLNTGDTLCCFSGHDSWVSCLLLQGHPGSVDGSDAAHPAGKQMLSGGDDRAIRVWNVYEGRAVKTLCTLDSPVAAIKWSPSGIVAASSLGQIKLFR